jgi:hypothetical protein
VNFGLTVSSACTSICDGRPTRCVAAHRTVTAFPYIAGAGTAPVGGHREVADRIEEFIFSGPMGA